VLWASLKRAALFALAIRAGTFNRDADQCSPGGHHRPAIVVPTRMAARQATVIPHHMLSHDALRDVIEACITREGTDYSAQDVSLEIKVGQVRPQLDEGTAVLVYDEDTESCTIQPTNQLPDHP
jgi:uncharacterized protein YheU (UPF0270 family)